MQYIVQESCKNHAGELNSFDVIWTSSRWILEWQMELVGWISREARCFYPEGNADLRAPFLVPLYYSTFLKRSFWCQKWPSKALFTPSNNMFLIEIQYISLVRPPTHSSTHTLHFFVAETGHYMIVYHSCGLHVRITDGRSNEAKAASFQVLAHGHGFRSLSG